MTATKTDQTDSGWTVTGTITVTNPNTWQSVTLTGVTDALSAAGATCTVTGETTATLAKSGGSVKLDYTCTYAAQPASYSGTNTATATWDQAAAHTAHGSASGTTAYTLDLAKETNDSVTVTDTVGGVTTTLGTVAIGESPKDFTVWQDRHRPHRVVPHDRQHRDDQRDRRHGHGLGHGVRLRSGDGQQVGHGCLRSRLGLEHRQGRRRRPSSSPTPRPVRPPRPTRSA
ncbi:MAG: hypothetical protein V9F04_16290 [Dermatophilaceae bacterium]